MNRTSLLQAATLDNMRLQLPLSYQVDKSLTSVKHVKEAIRALNKKQETGSTFVFRRGIYGLGC